MSPPRPNSIVGTIKRTKFHEIIWTIDRFYNTPSVTLSPIFSINYCNQKADLRIQLYPRGSIDTSDNTISIFLNNQNKFDVTVGYRFSLLDREGEHICETVSNENKTIEAGKSSGFSNFTQRNIVTNWQNHILNNNQLVISCLIEVTNTSISNEVKEQQEIEKDAHLSRISTLDDFEKMYNDGAFSDVTVSAADGKDFHLHKFVLVSRSPVFQAMFNNEMKESNENSVVIEDFSYETMKDLFRFMYTGKVEQIKLVQDDLLKAAHKYCIEDLLKMCEKALCKKLALDNVIEYLVLADLYSANNLKAEAIKFVLSHGKNIVHKPKFKSLVNQETACEIICAIFPNDEE